MRIIENEKIREFVRFGIVGLIATAVHYGLYLLCRIVMPLNVAYTIGWVISLALNFLLTARFTFRRSMTVLRAGGFLTSHLINYALHIILFNFWLWVGIPSTYAPLLVFAIVIPVNFILVRFVFNKL